MRNKAKRTGGLLASLAVMSVALPIATTVPATAQVSSGSRCPAGYWLYGSLCLNNATGDVVLAAAAAASGTAAEVGCRPGYWRHDALCMNLTTGDVELAETGVQSARAGN